MENVSTNLIDFGVTIEELKEKNIEIGVTLSDHDEQLAKLKEK